MTTAGIIQQLGVAAIYFYSYGSHRERGGRRLSLPAYMGTAKAGRFLGDYILFRGERIYEIVEALTNRRVLDREIGPDQFACFRLAQQVDFGGFGLRLGNTHCRRAYWVGIIEEERHRHIQHPAQLVQTARRDPVRAAFILL